MKLAVSNIAWSAEDDGVMLSYLSAHECMGLEIAPTRIFPETPYEKLAEAQGFSERLWQEHHLCVASMQSIWYGRQEALFGTEEERAALFAYTEQAIAFATAMHCTNLVFGCPKNRVRNGRDDAPVLAFFRAVADAAARAGVVFSLEANPPIYQTDYLNRTTEVLDLVERIQSPGLRANLDLGAMVENGEAASILKGRVHLIHHVHLSEPYLKPVVRRALHADIADVLRSEGYDGFISLEMGRQETRKPVQAAVTYLGEVFGDGISRS